MNRTVTRKSILAAVILVAVTLTASADDWPQFFGPNRDGINKETGLMKKWPADGPKMLWERAIGEGFSCMSISNGRMFSMGQKADARWVVAYEAKKGDVLWTYKLGLADRGNGFAGPRSTPTVDGDFLYVFGMLGELVCLNVKDGGEVWKLDTFKKFGVKNLTWKASTSPLVDGEKVIVNVGESNGSSVVAFNKKNGAVIWKSLGDMAGYSSPVIRIIDGVRQLVVFTAKGCVGMSIDDGKEFWRIPWKTQYDVHASTPVVKDNLVFISSGYNSGCALIEVKMTPTPTAKVLQTSRVMRQHFGTGVLIGDYFYGIDDRTLRCINFKTLESKWETKDYKKGNLVVADGMAYILGEKGGLTLARLTPEKLDIVSMKEDVLLNPPHGRNWTMPVVANGLLYARNEERLVCIDVAEK